MLGGDHSVALGTLGGLAQRERAGRRALDRRARRPEHARDLAHGNVHGMPLAAALGLADGRFESDVLGLPGASIRTRVALVGLRSVDARRARAHPRGSGSAAYTMSDIDRIGIERVISESLARIAGPGFVHVSLDMDALDPEVAPGVGTPVRGGLSYREAHLALELVAESGLVGSFEVVEVNPILDRENATAALAVELVASALGKTIL